MQTSPDPTRRLEFAIYPLGVAGTPHGLATGPPDDFEQIRRALQDLGGLAARTYLVDMEPGGEDAVLALADRYRDQGLLGHATLGCLRDDFDLARWTELVRTLVGRHGDQLRSLQITNEPNLSFMDGSKPYVLEALVSGVLAAKDEACRREIPLDVGFGSVPQSEVSLPRFWTDLAAAGGRAFTEAVDFVGHNFYVDVFEPPVELAQIPIVSPASSPICAPGTSPRPVSRRQSRSGSPRTVGQPAPTRSAARENGRAPGRGPRRHRALRAPRRRRAATSPTTCSSGCVTPTAPSPTSSTSSGSCGTTTRRSLRTRRTARSSASSPAEASGVGDAGDVRVEGDERGVESIVLDGDRWRTLRRGRGSRGLVRTSTLRTSTPRDDGACRCRARVGVPAGAATCSTNR